MGVTLAREVKGLAGGEAGDQGEEDGDGETHCVCMQPQRQMHTISYMSSCTYLRFVVSVRVMLKVMDRWMSWFDDE